MFFFSVIQVWYGLKAMTNVRLNNSREFKTFYYVYFNMVYLIIFSVLFELLNVLNGHESISFM